jgi:hypothetical protein
MQEPDGRGQKPEVMALRPKNPSSLSRRPPEPLRPIPATKVVETTTIAVQARRRRFSHDLGRRGGW